MTYTLTLSDEEVARYRLMAERARASEADAWRFAGVVPGARVADVGCGPGLVLAEIARAVGSDGRAVGIEANEQTAATARAILGSEDLRHARVVVADAKATGLASSSFDVVMARHVLAHNGGQEQEIVNHLSTLLRSGGHLYLVDVDVTAVRMTPADPDLLELQARYVALMAALGNDVHAGTKLRHLIEGAGLEVREYKAVYEIVEVYPGLRPPAWAARAALLERGLATAAEIDRWGEAFRRFEETPGLKLLFAPVFRAIGLRV